MSNLDNTDMFKQHEDAAKSKCPFHTGGFMQPEAMAEPVIPDRIKRLPVMRGYPVPFFVGHHPDTGERDFRIADSEKLRACIKGNLCWVCGEGLGTHKSFVIGPMCGVTRTSSEPPSHHECAVYSAQFCPFLTKPNMKRRGHEEIKAITEATTPGEMIDRNPGVCAVWTTKDFKLFSDGRGGVLIRVGDPINVEWFAEGRIAKRAEVDASIASGIGILRDMCDSEPTPQGRALSHAELDVMQAKLEDHLPSI